MASRFARQNDARNALFSNYDPSSSSSRSSRPNSAASNKKREYNSLQDNFAPGGGGGVYGAYNNNNNNNNNVLSPYGGVSDKKNDDAGFRAATPDGKGRYSDAVLESLESQNEDQAGEMSRKVKMLKELTIAIGDEIRDSTKLADSMNDSFEGARNRLRGTMNRMLRMAERTGVGWKVWVGFFVFIWCLFAYVWLF